MSDFGSRLKKARKDKNITQKELARVLGVAQSAIANYENNTRFPGLDILREISDFLNVSLDHLLGVEIKHENQTSQLLNKRDYQTLANEFMELLLDYREEQAKDLIKHVRSQGVMLTTIIQRIFIPVLYNIGIGWQRGEVSVAQEHYITAIIDRMIDFLSESQGVGPSLEFSSVFMSPGGEEHVLSLKMAAEFFKAAGWAQPGCHFFRKLKTGIALQAFEDFMKFEQNQTFRIHRRKFITIGVVNKKTGQKLKRH